MGGELTREQKEFRELQEGFNERPDVLDDPRTPHERSNVDLYWELHEKLEYEDMLGSLEESNMSPPTST